MKIYDNNTIALVCITVIIIVSIIYKVEGIKEVILALGGAIAGWMARSSSVGSPK